MPLKRGGGNHMQLYDPTNGEYTDEEKERMKSYDDFALLYYELYGNKSNYKFHFPIEGIHNEKYCNKFIKAIREDINPPTYVCEKINYLLSYQEGHDKSKFLKSLGYSERNPYELFCDICKNTNINSLKFFRFSSGAFILHGQTILKGMMVTTGWRLDPNLDLFLVTLIPGGDKKWKK